MSNDDTPERIKRVARRMFAERGIDGVSVREIVALAGQKNNGSLHYYFRNKEALVRELVREGAQLIDDRRNALLDATEARGGPNTVRELIEILVRPSTGLDEHGGEDTYTRFITILQMGHRELFLDALEKRWNSGYQRCLAHIRRLLPYIPESVLNGRLVMLGIVLGGVLSAREAALDRIGGRGRGFWRAASTLENFIDVLEAGLALPPSAETRRLMFIEQTQTPDLAQPKPPTRSRREKVDLADPGPTIADTKAPPAARKRGRPSPSGGVNVRD